MTDAICADVVRKIVREKEKEKLARTASPKGNHYWQEAGEEIEYFRSRARC